MNENYDNYEHMTEIDWAFNGLLELIHLAAQDFLYYCEQVEGNPEKEGEFFADMAETNDYLETRVEKEFHDILYYNTLGRGEERIPRMTSKSEIDYYEDFIPCLAGGHHWVKDECKACTVPSTVWYEGAEYTIQRVLGEWQTMTRVEINVEHDLITVEAIPTHSGWVVNKEYSEMEEELHGGYCDKHPTPVRIPHNYDYCPACESTF